MAPASALRCPGRCGVCLRRFRGQPESRRCCRAWLVECPRGKAYRMAARGVGHAVVDVLVAVDVPLSRAARMVDVNRRDWAVAQIVPYAAGHQLPYLGI